MTLGGFIQPSVACALSSNKTLRKDYAKDFYEQFPTIVTFDQLQQVDTGFMSVIGEFQLTL